MEMTTLFGLALGVGGILLGNALEDGHLSSLIQFTAGIIVFGGTAGATIVGNRKQDLKLGFKLLRSSFRREDASRMETVAKEIGTMARLARKESILSMEPHLKGLSHPFLRETLRFVIDGADPEAMKKVFEPGIEMEEQKLQAGAKVWSDAGGYAPTIGIIGAVLGLIHVMGNITNTSELGKGIAVAFVATIYGIASANLFFLPIASKIRRRIELDRHLKVMILDGAMSIGSGMNPFLIDEKLRGYLNSVRT